jgi:serine/threonine-protein kinase
MAPEQVLRDPLTPAADVYGLGSLLYEMLTGHWPTERPTDDDEWNEWSDNDDSEYRGINGPENLDSAQLVARYPQLTTGPIPPREHHARISPDLERVLLRCLDPDPSARFQTVSGLLAALAPLLKGRYRLWPKAAPIERRTDTDSR